jgi:hypothetical protein
MQQFAHPLAIKGTEAELKAIAMALVQMGYQWHESWGRAYGPGEYLVTDYNGGSGSLGFTPSSQGRTILDTSAGWDLILSLARQRKDGDFQPGEWVAPHGTAWNTDGWQQMGVYHGHLRGSFGVGQLTKRSSRKANYLKRESEFTFLIENTEANPSVRGEHQLKRATAEQIISLYREYPRTIAKPVHPETWQEGWAGGAEATVGAAPNETRGLAAYLDAGPDRKKLIGYRLLQDAPFYPAGTVFFVGGVGDPTDKGRATVNGQNYYCPLEALKQTRWFVPEYAIEPPTEIKREFEGKSFLLRADGLVELIGRNHRRPYIADLKNLLQRLDSITISVPTGGYMVDVRQIHIGCEEQGLTISVATIREIIKAWEDTYGTGIKG